MEKFWGQRTSFKREELEAAVDRLATFMRQNPRGTGVSGLIAGLLWSIWTGRSFQFNPVEAGSKLDDNNFRAVMTIIVFAKNMQLDSEPFLNVVSGDEIHDWQEKFCPQIH